MLHAEEMTVYRFHRQSQKGWAARWRPKNKHLDVPFSSGASLLGCRAGLREQPAWRLGDVTPNPFATAGWQQAASQLSPD